MKGACNISVRKIILIKLVHILSLRVISYSASQMRRMWSISQQSIFINDVRNEVEAENILSSPEFLAVIDFMRCNLADFK